MYEFSVLSYLTGGYAFRKRHLPKSLEAAATIEDVWSEPFLEAVEFFIRKGVISRADFDKLPDALKAKYFTIAGFESEDLIEAVQLVVRDTIQDGATLNEFRKSLSETLDHLGVGPTRPWHIDLIYSQNASNSYHAGFFETLHQPDVVEEFPYLEYLSMDDDRVRPAHIALDGRIFSTSEIGAFYPPNGFRCRCTVAPLSRAEAEARGVVGPDQIPETITITLEDGTERTYPVVPDKGFNADPSEAFREPPER